MKLHLPLSLFKAIIHGLRGIARTPFGKSALLITPAAAACFCWLVTDTAWQSPFMQPEAAEEQQRACDGRNAEGEFSPWGGSFTTPADAERDLAHNPNGRTLAYTTLADMCATPQGFISGSGGLGIGHATAHRRDDKCSSISALRPYLYITAGTLPIYNYVAHGGRPSGGGQQASTNNSSTPATTNSNSPEVASAPPAPAPAPMPRMARMMRSMALMSAPAPQATKAAHIWIGDRNDGVWDNTTENWTLNGQRSTISSTGEDSATFNQSGRGKDINITTNQTLDNMNVMAAGYTFSGGGNINVLDTLTIQVAEVAGASYEAPATITFGQANNVTAGTIIMQSGMNTEAIFGADVHATGTLTIRNCVQHVNAEKAGAYTFNGNLTTGGAVSVTLGSGAGAQAQTLLTVHGNTSAASLTLDGSGKKNFYGTVTTTGAGGTAGNLTISGHEEHIHAQDGTTTFYDDVIIAEGGSLVIKNNSEAIFNSRIDSAAGAGQLQTVLDHGEMNVKTFISSMSSGQAYDLGTITLLSQGELTLGPRSVTEVDVQSGGQNFTVGGSATRADIYLITSNSGDFTAAGGNVHLYSNGGKVGGTLYVDGGGTTLTLKSNNILSETRPQGSDSSITVSGGGTLNLGSSQQDIEGTITLRDAGTISGNAGSALVAAAPSTAGDVATSTIAYAGGGNALHATINQHAGNILTISGSGSEEDTLSLSGTISALTPSGTSATQGHQLLFTGTGNATITGNTGYTGAVRVENGSTLELAANRALYNASSLTLGDGGALSIDHDGTSVEMQGNLMLESGAAINFTNLIGHDTKPALALKGDLYFGGDVTFRFGEQAELQLENLHTYELISSESGINGGTGSVAVYAGGSEEALASSQYAFGFYIDDENLRHFTFTLLAGKSWIGGDGYWHQQTEPGTYDNWTEGDVGNYALFRTQEAHEAVTIQFDEPTAAQGFYMDGSTSYTIAGTKAMTDAFVGKTPEGDAPGFIKKGSGNMTLSNITGTLGAVQIEQGTLALVNASSLSTTDAITIADVSYAVPEGSGLAAKDKSAALSISNNSVLRQGDATISGYGNNNATLHGLRVEGNSISAYSSGLSGTAEVPSTHTVTHAAVSGFSLFGVELQGIGSLYNTTLGSGTSFAAGANYALHGNIVLEDTVNAGNNSRLSFSSGSTVLDISAVDSLVQYNTTANTSSTTYTVFNAGGYGTNFSGWTPDAYGKGGMSAGDFRLYGSGLNNIKNISTTTSISSTGDATLTVNASGVAFVAWDNAWDAYLPADNTKPLVAINLAHEAISESLILSRKQIVDTWINDWQTGKPVPGLTHMEYTDDYTYSQRLVSTTSADEHVYTVNLMDVTSLQGKYISGFDQLPEQQQEADKVEVWINSIHGPYEGICAGANNLILEKGYGPNDKPIFLGDTHLQLIGAHDNAKDIMAGSQFTRQFGDSFLTFAAGQYVDASGKLIDTTTADFRDTAITAGNMGHFIVTDTGSNYHKGNSFLHISSGTFASVFGGSLQTYTEGTSRVLVDGGTIAILQGGDFTSRAATVHTTDSEDDLCVRIDLKGGTLTQVYAAGGYAHVREENNDDTGDYQSYIKAANVSTVDGNTTINLHAGLNANGELVMLTQFAASKKYQAGYDIFIEDELPLLYGGANVVSGTSTLAFSTENGRYDLRQVELEQFDAFSLANGAVAEVTAHRFNDGDAKLELTLSGAGTVIVTGSAADRTLTGPHTVRLEEGATLHLNTTHYLPRDNGFGTIVATEGTTIDATYDFQDGTDKNALNIALIIEGRGVDGKGALYKGTHTVEGGNFMAEASGTSFPHMSLTGDATMGLEHGTSLNMIESQVLNAGTKNEKIEYHGTTIDLAPQAAPGGRGYVLTVDGGGIFGMYRTAISGGTLDVHSGTVESNLSSTAGNTDIVLRSAATLHLTDMIDGDNNYGYEPDGTTPAEYNGIAIESLSGSGTVNLGQKGWLYINMDANNGTGYGEFSKSVNANGLEGYAHFSGRLTDEGGGLVSKSGGGTQYFSGSESTYAGGTSVRGGILYLTGSSSAAAGGFSKGSSTTVKGVIGTGDLTWEGGSIYLGNGVNLYNDGRSGTSHSDGSTTAPIIIGVAAEGEGTSKTYDVATYSGFLSGTGSIVKLGGGTLILTQDGSFNGRVAVQEGSLNLRHWADAGDYEEIAVSDGATLALTYDNSGLSADGTVNEITAFNTLITLSGQGDARWETLNGPDAPPLKTAALCSGIGSSKQLDIQGIIQGTGNVLHSGSGTLTLSGANTYSGGTTVDGGGVYANGTLIVAHDTALGTTAAGQHANLTTREDSRVVFANGVETTLAAVTTEEYAGNDIQGSVAIGIAHAANDGTTPAAARLTMEGNGYYATRTELEENGTLVFSGNNASNWDGITNSSGTAPASTNRMEGAGTLAGNGTVVVTNSSSHFDSNEEASTEGTTVYFQVTDSLHEGESGFAGDIVVEGDNTRLHIQGGELDGGNYSISGNGARLDAKRSAITVNEGQKISLSSMGDAYREANSTAVLAAYSVHVQSDGHLLASYEATRYQFDADNPGHVDDTQIEVEFALGSYKTADGNYDYHITTGNIETQYDKYFASNKIDNQNRQTSAVLETVGGLTMEAGSIYELYDTNVSLAGTQLTFNVTDETKIKLRGDQIAAYIQSLLEADAAEALYDSQVEQGITPTVPEIAETDQLVLFSDVGSFNAILDGNNLTEGAEALQFREMRNQIYVMLARDFLCTDGLATPQTVSGSGDATTPRDPLADATNILLVYDAGARVVYLDRNPNLYEPLTEEDYHPIVLPVPEPSTATLSLLALAALAARRRRK